MKEKWRQWARRPVTVHDVVVLEVFSVLMTIVLIFSIVAITSGGQQDLANRIDTATSRANTGIDELRALVEAEKASDRRIEVVAEHSDLELQKHRYVSDCLFFTPPHPERTLADLVRCTLGANELKPGQDGVEVLMRQLRRREQ